MKRMTFDEFVSKSKSIHQDIYSYPLQEYVNNKTKVKIYCKRCKCYFNQLPCTHLRGKGHKNCSLRTTKEKFESDCILKYKNRFKYDLSSFEKITSKISIICNDCKHKYVQKAIDHLNARNGCPKCAIQQARCNIRKSFNSFWKESINRNGDIFEFDIVEIPFSRKSKLNVLCKYCGNNFESCANYILNKTGCPSCSHNSKHPDTLGYVYQLYYDSEPIKYIGITTSTLKTRLKRHLDVVKYKKVNTKIYNFLKDKDLSKLSIVEIEKTKAKHLANREQYWMEKLNTIFPNGFNKNKGGSGLNLKYINNEYRENTKSNRWSHFRSKE